MTRLEETERVARFFEEEKGELEKKVGGAAQYAVKQKNCDVDVYGTTNGALGKAVQKQRAVYEAFPRSKCSLAFRAIAQKVDTWPLPSNPRGHLEFFVERLVRAAPADTAL